jgi:hypothetical protein
LYFVQFSPTVTKKFVGVLCVFVRLHIDGEDFKRLTRVKRFCTVEWTEPPAHHDVLI